MISLDTETTGLDLHHDAKPFMVQTCDEKGKQTWWEWPVNPLTREPEIPARDLREIQRMLDKADEIVLQNPKFDVTALRTVMPDLKWDWGKTRDTLLAGHLLASNQPHDLTTMALIYLDVNVKPHEDTIEKATKEARRIAKREYPDWKVSQKDMEGGPSVKEKTWKHDMWLPIEVAKAENYPRGECSVVNRRREEFDVYIGRGSVWGNPFVIGKDGNRQEVIAKYALWLKNNQELLGRLPELDGKRLGCFCKPEDCHGDMLVALVGELRHPWFSLCADYGLSDSETTLALYLRQRELLKERKLWKIYEERLKVLPVVYEMENYGITLNRNRLNKLVEKYREESEEAGGVCVGIAESLDYELDLPKGSNNNSLKEFVFGPLKLPQIKMSKKTGAPSLDKEVMETYLTTLPERGKQLLFVKKLLAKRGRDTALSYMKSYEKFWLPLDESQTEGYTRIIKGKKPEWYRLHPSLNPTGTDTLRWSSKNPNEQNISKKEGFNLRYCFGPAPGREWWALDAKNIELRIPAYEADETEQIELFERPDDPPYYGSNHLLVCHVLHPEKFEECVADGVSFKDRYKTEYGWVKNGNFAVQYGAVEASGTADRAYHVVGGQRLIQSRFRRVSELNELMIEFASEHGYVETIPDKTVDPDHGYPLLCSRNRWGSIKPTVPLNYHVQGTAMWWMMKAMIRCQAYLDTLRNCYMIMQVHDELVFDFPKGKKQNLPKIRKLAKLMEQGGDDIGIPTPVNIEYHAETWSEGVTL